MSTSFFILNFLILALGFLFFWLVFNKKLQKIKNEISALMDYLNFVDQEPINLNLIYTKIEIGEGTGRKNEITYEEEFQIMPRNLAKLKEILNIEIEYYQKEVNLNLKMDTKGNISFDGKVWFESSTFKTIISDRLKEMSL